MNQPDAQKTLSAAWTRIHHSEWNQIAWFVRLVNTDMTKLSEGDLLKWKEDFRAMECEDSDLGIFQRPSENDVRYWKPNNLPVRSLPNLPALEDMQEVRSAVTQVLTDLADGRDTDGPRLYAEYYVSFKKTSVSDEKRGLPRYQIMRCEIGQPLILYSETLPIRLALLLERHAEKVRRCLGCKQIFVQLKKTRKYCESRCQARTSMQKLRKRRKDLEEKKGTSKTQKHDRRSKGAVRGKK